MANSGKDELLRREKGDGYRRTRIFRDGVILFSLENASDLGGDDEFVPVLPPQEVAEPVFAQAVAVKWRGVEIAYAGIPGRLKNAAGLL